MLVAELFVWPALSRDSGEKEAAEKTSCSHYQADGAGVRREGGRGGEAERGGEGMLKRDDRAGWR